MTARLSSLFVAFCLGLLVAFTPSKAQAQSSPEPEGHPLRVLNGSGDGTYASGTNVEIEADDKSGDGFIFLGWFMTQNGGGTLDSPFSANTTFTMGSNTVELSAVYARADVHFDHQTLDYDPERESGFSLPKPSEPNATPLRLPARYVVEIFLGEAYDRSYEGDTLREHVKKRLSIAHSSFPLNGAEEFYHSDHVKWFREEVGGTPLKKDSYLKGEEFEEVSQTYPETAFYAISLHYECHWEPVTDQITGNPIPVPSFGVQGEFSFRKAPRDWITYPKRALGDLLPVDIDVIHPATGELAEDREDGTNPTSPDGGYVSVKRTVGSDVIGGEDVTPITKLKIHAIAGAQSTWKTRVKFSGADRYIIYKDEERTEEVLSEQTEFDATQTTTLYFQGLKKSLSRGGENIAMQVKVGNNWVEGDSVKCTVVQSEFLIQIKAFIPYEWTEGEDVFPFPDPLLGKVAKGDFSATSRPTFKNAFSNKVPFYSVAPFRLCHEVILTPYVDLHYFYQDIEEKRQFTSAPSSDHYAKATSVDPTELALKNGYLPLTPPIDATGPPVLSPATYSPELSLYNSLRANKCALDLTGSGRDGALGIYTNVSPAIDWDVRLEIDSSSNPLQPSFRVKGKHDLYPAYEIITLQADGTFKDTHRHMPARNVLPGPESLFAAPSITFDNTGTISN